MKDRPKLILFCGIPGAGKTTLAKKLEIEGRGIRICTDDWQDDLKIPYTEKGFHGRLQKRLYSLALELLDYGQNVILEDGLWTKPERDQKLGDAEQHGALVEMHLFDLTFEEIWQRLSTRNANLAHGSVHITKEDLQKCWNVFERPTEEELRSFDKVFIHKAA